MHLYSQCLGFQSRYLQFEHPLPTSTVPLHWHSTQLAIDAGVISLYNDVVNAHSIHFLEICGQMLTYPPITLHNWQSHSQPVIESLVAPFASKFY